MVNKNIIVIIPAYNEEQNITYLLKDVLAQKTTNLAIQKIVVLSDGSTDQTAKKARGVKSNIVDVKNFSKRAGKSGRLNQAFKTNKNSILVVLDADIKIYDKNFLVKLTKPILNGRDLTSSAIGYVTPRSTTEKILGTSIDLINNVFKNYKWGDNVYTCRGVARAFSVKLARNIKFPENAGDDAFSYFFCKANNYKYKFVPAAVSFIRLPNNMNDHIKQSSRFVASISTMQKLFKSLNMDIEYKLPRSLFIKEILIALCKKPILNLSYIALNLYTLIVSRHSRRNVTTWDIAASSKNLNS